MNCSTRDIARAAQHKRKCTLSHSSKIRPAGRLFPYCFASRSFEHSSTSSLAPSLSHNHSYITHSLTHSLTHSPTHFLHVSGRKYFGTASPQRCISVAGPNTVTPSICTTSGKDLPASYWLSASTDAIAAALSTRTSGCSERIKYHPWRMGVSAALRSS